LPMVEVSHDLAARLDAEIARRQVPAPDMRTSA
jgi:hypothetical protein